MIYYDVFSFFYLSSEKKKNTALIQCNVCLCISKRNETPTSESIDQSNVPNHFLMSHAQFFSSLWLFAYSVWPKIYAANAIGDVAWVKSFKNQQKNTTQNRLDKQRGESVEFWTDSFDIERSTSMLSLSLFSLLSFHFVYFQVSTNAFRFLLKSHIFTMHADTHTKQTNLFTFCKLRRKCETDKTRFDCLAFCSEFIRITALDKILINGEHAPSVYNIVSCLAACSLCDWPIKVTESRTSERKRKKYSKYIRWNEFNISISRAHCVDALQMNSFCRDYFPSFNWNAFVAIAFDYGVSFSSFVVDKSNQLVNKPKSIDICVVRYALSAWYVRCGFDSVQEKHFFCLNHSFHISQSRRCKRPNIYTYSQPVWLLAQSVYVLVFIFVVRLFYVNARTRIHIWNYLNRKCARLRIE